MINEERGCLKFRIFGTVPIFTHIMKTRKKQTKRVKRTRNAGTMTEAAFWGMIRAALRQKSRWWKPIAQAKAEAKRRYKGPNKRQLWEYQCNSCKNWFPDKQVNVDHINPAGSLTCSADLPGFVERLFCEVDNLQCLCTTCHDVKTKSEKEASIKRKKAA